MPHHAPSLDLVGAARALDVPPTDLAVHLAHLDAHAVDLDDALQAGDPTGLLDGLAAELQRSSASVALALARATQGASDAPPRADRGAKGLDLGPLRDLLDARLRATLRGDEGAPPWLVNLLNPFAPHRETVLDAWVRRLHRWRRGLALGGLLVAAAALAAGSGMLLDPAATASVLSVALPVALVALGFGTLTVVVLASGYASARVDRLDHLRGRLGQEPGRVVREAADRVGVDDALRRAAIRAALRAAEERPGAGPRREGPRETDVEPELARV